MRIIDNIKGLFKSKTVRNGMLFSAFSFLNSGFSFLLLLILASFITPSEYGYLSLYATVLMVIGYFIALSSEGYMDVAFFKDRKNGITNTFSSVFLLALSILLFLLLIVSLRIPGLNSFLEFDNVILYIALFTSFFTVFNNLLLSVCRVKENIKAYGMLSCGSAILNFTLSIILVKYCSLSWQGRVYAQGSCALIFGQLACSTFSRTIFLQLM